MIKEDIWKAGKTTKPNDIKCLPTKHQAEYTLNYHTYTNKQTNRRNKQETEYNYSK